MARLRENEIRRRADGSIDTGFYAARAAALRKTEIAETRHRLAALIARLKAALRMRRADKSAWSMSPESGNRFRDNDMRKNKDLRRIA